MKMKKIIPVILLTILFILTGIYNDKISRFIISNFVYEKHNNNYSFNSYSKRENYNYLVIVKDFEVHNKKDIINTIYTIIDSGADEFSFYCASSYSDCIRDIVNMASNTEELAVINNFVHPYNNYNKLYISTNALGKVTITVDKLYEDEEITYIENKLDDIEKSVVTENMNLINKIKAIHDYIINTTIYDEERAEEIRTKGSSAINEIQSNKANGVLESHYALCSGYTDIMTIYLNRLGIRNYKISNNTHVWNGIYLDNNWLHIDLTWDDPVTSNNKNILLEDFFLIDNNELAKLDRSMHDFDLDIYSEFAANK